MDRKSNRFNNLTKNQKSSFVSFLKSFVKKYQCFSEMQILQKFNEQIEYEIQINNARFPWLQEFFYEESFLKDVKFVIKEKIKEIEIKNRQKPFLEKQKEQAKAYKQKAINWRQAHEKPTKKQISYYFSLCDKYKIDRLDINGKSKFDLKILISEILENKGKNEQL